MTYPTNYHTALGNVLNALESISDNERKAGVGGIYGSFAARTANTALTAGREALQTQGEMVPQAWTNLLAYVLQDDMHNRLTPRIVDIAYTAFTLAKRPNTEDGGASDWFNDTKPKVAELIAKLRKDLIEEMPATHPQATEPAPSTAVELRPSDDELWDQTLCDRDRYHDVADDLAAQIAAITGEDIGEHSNANDPWRNAMLAADEFIVNQLRSLLQSDTRPVGDLTDAEIDRIWLLNGGGLAANRYYDFARAILAAARTQPELVPMTDEQIAAAFGWSAGHLPLDSEIRAARAIERAHGIGCEA